MLCIGVPATRSRDNIPLTCMATRDKGGMEATRNIAVARHWINGH
jgi:hypothetical protein